MRDFLPKPHVVRELPTDVTGERCYLLSNGDIVESVAPEPIMFPVPSAPAERELNRHERRAAAKVARTRR